MVGILGDHQLFTDRGHGNDGRVRAAWQVDPLRNEPRVTGRRSRLAGGGDRRRRGRIPERHCHRPVWHWQHGELRHRYAQQGNGEDHLDADRAPEHRSPAARLDREAAHIPLAERQPPAVRDGIAAQQQRRDQRHHLDEQQHARARCRRPPGDQVLRGAGDRQREHAQPSKTREPRRNPLQRARRIARDEQGREGHQAAQPGRQGQQVQARRRGERDDPEVTPWRVDSTTKVMVRRTTSVRTVTRRPPRTGRRSTSAPKNPAAGENCQPHQQPRSGLIRDFAQRLVRRRANR